MMHPASLSRWILLAAIFVTFAVAMTVDIIYAETRETFRFSEYGPITTVKAIASLMAGLMGVAIWRAMPPTTGAWTDGRNFWLLAGLGLVFLAFDDYFQVHETLGRESWERWQFDPPLFNRTDDLIVAVYGVAGLALVVVYWREIVLGGLSGLLLAGALVAAAVMTLADAWAEKGSLAAGLEDPAHVISSALFLAAFAVKWRELVPDASSQSRLAGTVPVERPT